MVYLPHAKTIIGAAQARGHPVPGVYADPPNVRADLVQTYEAFGQVSTCRPAGFGGEGQIPWTVIMQYADYLEMDELDDRAEFTRLIRAMDREYLEVRAEQQRAKSK
tara:strand:- start:1317 stop:1637 length:321 start_codon:yes stop_codon:yes gene_type:complete